MQLNAKFDQESSKMSQKLIFSCEDFELRQEDIAELKKKKLITYVQENDLPEIIPCQVLIFLEYGNKAQITFFNPKFELPEKIFETPWLNKDLIERNKKNWGFWMECAVPLYDDCIKFDFSYITE